MLENMQTWIDTLEGHIDAILITGISFVTYGSTNPSIHFLHMGNTQETLKKI